MTDIQAELNERGLHLVRATEHDDFLDAADEVNLSAWPEFMLHDIFANRYWRKLHEFATGFQFALVENVGGTWIAVGNSIPLRWHASFEDLPDKGWDWAISTGVEALQKRESPNLLCALAIQIKNEYRGQDLSSLMIRIMRRIGGESGLDRMIAPVRPNRKPDYPLLPMEDYLSWKKGKWPFDPWLRVHARLGARILKVCPQAMEIKGSVDEWEEWTGLSFRSSGDYIIPGALTPVTFDLEKDLGIYIEPNVWMIHSS